MAGGVAARSGGRRKTQSRHEASAKRRHEGVSTGGVSDRHLVAEPVSPSPPLTSP